MAFSLLKRKTRKGVKRLYHTLALAIAGTLFVLFVTLARPFNSYSLWLTDQLFLPETPSENIVIAGIDDSTLETYGRWQEWPRSLHARAIDSLSAAGARVISFDVVLLAVRLTMSCLLKQ